MRVFVGLDIDESIRERIERFMEGVRGFAPDGRWVRPESLHVTLKFIGEKSPAAVGHIQQTLSAVGAAPFDVTFRGYGFFPNAKAARVFWIGISADSKLAALASQVDQATFATGVPKEEHVYSPHLTLARAGTGAPTGQKGDSPNRRFQRLQEKLSALPEPVFGTMTACDFFLYESKLDRGGAVYTKVARFALDNLKSGDQK